MIRFFRFLIAAAIVGLVATAYLTLKSESPPPMDRDAHPTAAALLDGLDALADKSPEMKQEIEKLAAELNEQLAKLQPIVSTESVQLPTLDLRLKNVSLDKITTFIQNAAGQLPDLPNPEWNKKLADLLHRSQIHSATSSSSSN